MEWPGFVVFACFGRVWGVGWFCCLSPWPPSVRSVLLAHGQYWPNRGTSSCKQKTLGGSCAVGFGWLLGWLFAGPWLVVWPLVLCCRFDASVTFRLRRSPAVMPCPSGLVLFPALLPYARRAVAGGPGGLVWRVVVLGLLFGLWWVPFCSRPPCIYETRSD